MPIRGRKGTHTLIVVCIPPSDADIVNLTRIIESYCSIPRAVGSLHANVFFGSERTLVGSSRVVLIHPVGFDLQNVRIIYPTGVRPYPLHQILGLDIGQRALKTRVGDLERVLLQLQHAEQAHQQDKHGDDHLDQRDAALIGPNRSDADDPPRDS